VVAAQHCDVPPDSFMERRRQTSILLSISQPFAVDYRYVRLRPFLSPRTFLTGRIPLRTSPSRQRFFLIPDSSGPAGRAEGQTA